MEALHRLLSTSVFLWPLVRLLGYANTQLVALRHLHLVSSRRCVRVLPLCCLLCLQGFQYWLWMVLVFRLVFV
jgi:hypothetical protein